jgi:hypothetical protein
MWVITPNSEITFTLRRRTVRIIADIKSRNSCRHLSMRLEILPLPWEYTESRDSSVSIALGYGLDNQGSRVRFPAGAGLFSLHHLIQNGSGAHLASYPMGTRGSLPGGKTAGT